jgi:phosphoglycerol transferase
MRSVAHLSLSNYFLAPLVIMVAIWIANEEIEVISRNKKQCLTVSNNKKLLATFLISVIAATNGIYYAFFSIIIFIFALLLAYLKKGKLITARSIVVPIFIILIATIVLYLNLPSSVYWIKHGPSHLASRTPYESELYALRINSLLLPVVNHYFDFLANIRSSFNNLTTQNESGAGSLGIIGSIGLLFLFFWTIFSNRSEENSIFQKILKKFSLDSKDQNFISDLAALNISLILFFTSGGLIMFFAIQFPHIRSHARISIFISFICLTAIALLCDKIRQKNYRLTTALFLTLFAFGILDQVGRISVGSGDPHSLIIQSDEMKKRFNYDKTFFSDVEKSLPQKSAIFIFPVQNFPEGRSYHSLTPYLHSKNLLWSFPTITRRENSIWQQSYYKKNFKEFFGEMKKFNFSAVVIDRKLYIGNKDLTGLAKLEAQLGSQIKKPPILSQNGDWAFYQIK